MRKEAQLKRRPAAEALPHEALQAGGRWLRGRVRGRAQGGRWVRLAIEAEQEGRQRRGPVRKEAQLKRRATGEAPPQALQAGEWWLRGRVQGVHEEADGIDWRSRQSKRKGRGESRHERRCN